ncbi:MAG: hypothetical protein WBW69_06690 [Candidatus Korobacteraceae bacterium]
MGDSHISLNASQRQRLLVTCKHIDMLLGDIEATLDATASKSVFPSYVADISPAQRKTIEDCIARIRTQLLQVLASQALAPEPPHISAAHSINVNLTFIDVAIAELAPRYMRGYGPVSEEGTADLNGIVAELESAVKELAQYIPKPAAGDGDDQKNEKLGRTG